MKPIKLYYTACLFSLSYFANAQTSSPVLSESDRVYGLSQIWSEAKYNFVYFDRIGLDWDSLYKATIPQVIGAKDTKTYYDVLRRFAAQLKDGHTGVWYPSSFYQREAAYAPLATDLVEGRVLITGVPDSLASRGWQRGMEILRINGEDVHTYAQRLAPFESASTPQGQEGVLYSIYLLNGPIDEPIKLTVKGLKNDVREMTLFRQIKRMEPSAVHYRVVSDDIGVLTINTFASNSFMKTFDSLYKQIQATKGLIIDLRQNTGGSGSQGEYLLKHLTKTAFPDPQISARQYNPLLKAWGQTSMSLYTILPGSNQPFQDRPLYDKPVIVLTGKLTASAAEDFTMQFDAIRRGKLIGQPTAGTTGQPFFYTLPGGGTLRICIRKDTYPDGREFVGVGIQPTIVVTEKAEAVRKGEDLVLQRAMEELKAGNR